MQRFTILFLAAFLLLAFSFVEKGTVGEAPGTIQAIGDAGSPQVFTFQKWAFTHFAMPEERVENIKLGIEINTSSLTCDWKDLEKNIRKKKDYFYVKKFPKAIVEIDGAMPTEDGRYTTRAMLTLKKKTLPVELTFTISDTKPYQVEGEGIILRRKFGFTGDGPKNEVPVSFAVTLPM